MVVFCQHKSNEICYNIYVVRKRGELIFDIGSGDKTVLDCFVALEPSARSTGRARSQSAPYRGWTAKPRASRADKAAERGAEESHPGLRHVRNSVLGFVAKPLTFHNEKPNTMVRRVAITRRTLFSCFSLRLLAAPATRRVSRVRRFSFPRRCGGTSAKLARKETIQ